MYGIMKLLEKGINKMNEKNEIKETIKWLLGLSEEEAKEVNQVIDDQGIQYLLLNLDKLDFKKEIIEKLNHLVTIIEKFDGSIENVDFEGKTNEK